PDNPAPVLPRIAAGRAEGTVTFWRSDHRPLIAAGEAGDFPRGGSRLRGSRDGHPRGDHLIGRGRGRSRWSRAWAWDVRLVSSGPVPWTDDLARHDLLLHLERWSC